MFLLPCLIILGLTLLLGRTHRRLGFCLIGLSVVLYVGFLFLETSLVRKQEVRTDWTSDGIWLTLSSLAVGASWLLKNRRAQN